MPTRNFSDVSCFPGAASEITSDGPHILVSLDTLGYNGGINFHAASPMPLLNYIDGTYKFNIEHSDELETGYETVPAEDIIGDTSDFPFLKDLEITGTLAAGKAMPFVQATKLKRYVGLHLVSSNVTTGALILVTYNLSKNNSPVDTSGDVIAYYQG